MRGAALALLALASASLFITLAPRAASAEYDGCAFSARASGRFNLTRGTAGCRLTGGAIVIADGDSLSIMGASSSSSSTTVTTTGTADSTSEAAAGGTTTDISAAVMILQVIVSAANETSPSRHFEVAGGASLSLSHVRLEGGRVLATADTLAGWGGTVLLHGAGASLTAHHVFFAGCGNAVCAYKGGAVYAHDGARVAVSASTFTHCIAEISGGAVFVEGAALFNYVNISAGTYFANNAARHGYGGAIAIRGKSRVTLLGGNNMFVQNEAKLKGHSIDKYDAIREGGAALLRFDVCRPGTYQDKLDQNAVGKEYEVRLESSVRFGFLWLTASSVCNPVVCCRRLLSSSCVHFML
jgi:hypothetical protein